MLSLLRTLSLRHVRRHRARTLLLGFSVSLGVAAWVAGSALDRALESALQAAASPMAGAADFQIQNGDLGVPKALAVLLRTVPGVRKVRPVVVQRVLLPEQRGQSAVLVGVDLLAERGVGSDLGLTVREASPSAFLRAALLKQSPVLVGASLDKTLTRSPPGLALLAGGKPHRFTPVGVIEATGPASALGGYVLVTDLESAVAVGERPDIVTRIDVVLEPNADRAAVRAQLEKWTAGLGRVLVPDAAGLRVGDVLGGLRTAFALCGAGALGLGFVVMAGTLSVGAAERRREVGVLRSLGADRRQIRHLFLGEAAVLGAAGAAVGLPLGWGLARLCCGPMLTVLSDVFLPLHARAPDLDLRTAAAGVIAGVTTAVLAALLPAARAAAVEPIEALSSAPATTRWSRRSSWGAALAAWGLAGLWFHWGDRLAPLTGILGALVLLAIGTIVALPVAVSLAAWLLRPLAERAFGLPGRLAADHVVRTPGTAGLAVASLAAGVALILQTGGVIHGNQIAVRDWLDRCIVGDLFVTSGGPLSASGQVLAMRDDTGDRIETDVPGARVVPMRFRYVNWPHQGREDRILLLALDAPRYYDINLARRPLLADLDLYRRLSEPGTAIVSENFASLYHVREGDAITLPGVTGPVALRVVGAVADYSCSRGTVIVDRQQHRLELNAGEVDVFSVSLPPTAPPAETARRLLQLPWAAEQAVVALTRDTLRHHVLGMVDRLYGIAYVQEFVAALVAALGVATALLVSVLQRRRDMGLLRAVGATPGQAGAVIVCEALLMAFIGAGLGLAIGVALEWYVLRIVLPAETGFAFPVRIPWANAASACGLAAVGALAASIAPALSVTKAQITEAIACE
ncbi:MAG: FtsX-like permease family protein [Isosphaeraceae bacterium]|nr:FtsX-like permease family protein [Isosphaeraceae bacterium]